MYKSAKRFHHLLDVAPNSFMVQFETGQDLTEITQTLEEFGATASTVLVHQMPEEARGHLLLVEMPADQTPREAVETLGRIPGVVFAEPNETVTISEKADHPEAIESATNLEHQDPSLTPSDADASVAMAPDAAPADAEMIVSIEAVSNDTGYANGSLWGMYGDKTTIANQYGSQAGEAWAAGYAGTMKTVVGVIDTGIDYTHPDLYLNIWLNQGEISTTLRAVLKDTDGDSLITFRDLNNVANANYVTDINKNGYIDAGDLLKDTRWENGADEDKNGYKDDLIGWDFANNDNDPFDDNGHGTHVSGTIGAMGGNGTGVVGVNWNVQIVAMKFMGADGSGFTSGAVQAVNYFTTESKLAPAGENFVATNNSWGGGGFSQALSDAVTLAAKSDILFIAAAGNDATNNDVTANYPSNLSTTAGAGYEAVIAVASLTDSGGLSYFSSYGARTVDLAAPGSSIYSTLPGGAYGTYSGTSMATPHVTGAVALYASAHPDASAATIRAALLASTDATASLTGVTASGGRLDVGNLLGTSSSQPAEIAGDFSTTAMLNLNAPCQSLIGVAGDQDWFKVTLTKGYVYTFAMDATAGSALDPYLQLLDSTGQELAASNDANGWSSSITVTANIDVTCFISAQGYKASIGAYSLSMTADIGSLNLVGTTRADNLIGGATNDSLSGLGGSDTLDGGLGADTMAGGAGNDFYFVDDSGDVVVEKASEGTDTVNASITWALGANVENLILTGTASINGAGNTLNNILTGNAAANVLDGGMGADTMSGGAGDDVYVVDNGSDQVIESASAGTDSVNASTTYSLTANVENLTLTGAATINGVGNALNNVITGNAAANILDGGAGADTMAGGAGNDVYIVDNAGDTIVEGASAGTDSVNSSISHALAANVENLTLTGSAAINGLGNALNNVITGNAGVNMLDGGAGADTMSGGAGDDSYVVDNTGDIVTEAASAGTDGVNSLVSYALTANVENLTLIGASAINGTGNTLNNVITGNAAANVIDGGAGLDLISGGAGNDSINGGLGSDTLDGGAGADIFIFNTTLGSTNVDRISGFVTIDDTIQLDHAIFTALGAVGALTVGAFNTGAAATQADDRVIYNTSTGALLYDADGSGKGGAIQFAHLSGLTGTLSAADFVVF